MHLINSIITWRLKKRLHQIELFIKYPINVQNECLFSLLEDAKNTEWGRRYDFSGIHSVADFKNRIPLQDYESIKNDINRTQLGQKNILWHSHIKWFAKSSGTTNDKSKFIPVSKEALHACHYKGGKDMLSLYCSQVEDTKVFTGKTIMMGGSSEVNARHDGTRYGDLSAIIVDNLPFWIDRYRLPGKDVHLAESWEDKIELMANQVIGQDITSFSGVPSWLLVLMNKVLEKSGADNLKELWPKLELFMHGGVRFDPYKPQFEKITKGINYLETYNASEGFFAIQHERNSSELLLMLDYGIFYEFIPMSQYDHEDPLVLSLEDVALHVNYAMVITTNAGLWRYVIGDTIVFTCLSPFRIKITGRTKHFINAFGEELIIDNAEKALKVACEVTGAVISDYTAAPLYLNEGKAGRHEWLIEFEKEPASRELFEIALDNTLKSLNSDYEAKRSADLLLLKPLVIFVEKGIFFKWLKFKKKLGAQYKVPRLSNNRLHVDDLLSFISANQ